MSSHARRWLWPLRQQLLRDTSRPILVGPFRGEVGFEALYWIPWLHALRKRFNIAPERLIPITRGGAGQWYDVPRWVELFQLQTPYDVRVENMVEAQTTGWAKQYAWTDFDRETVRRAAAFLGLRSYTTLHPSWFYHDLKPFWENQRGAQWLFERTDYTPMNAPTVQGLVLPEHFTAVRFYVRATFSPQMVQFVQETIKGLAYTAPVIVLSAGQALDDHVDILPKDRTNVIVLSEACPMSPEDNLAVQSAVLARADGFVGTYGGFAQLALRLKRPVICFFDQWHSTSIAHRQISEVIAQRQNVPFHVLQVGAIPLLQQVCPRVQITTTPQPVVSQPEQAVVA